MNSFQRVWPSTTPWTIPSLFLHLLFFTLSLFYLFILYVAKACTKLCLIFCSKNAQHWSCYCYLVSNCPGKLACRNFWEWQKLCCCEVLKIIKQVLCKLTNIVLFSYRYILWMPKYGMLYFPPFLVGFVVLSAIWVRLVANLFLYLQGMSE